MRAYRSNAAPDDHEHTAIDHGPGADEHGHDGSDHQHHDHGGTDHDLAGADHHHVIGRGVAVIEATSRARIDEMVVEHELQLALEQDRTARPRRRLAPVRPPPSGRRST
jgi:hypothetical protein